MHWRVYYSDETTISSEDATPFSIERRIDVQVIIQEHPEKGWLILCGYDYFMWDDRGGGAKWFRGNEDGLFQYLTKPGSKCVLLGTWIDDIAYRKVLNKAQKDRLFLSKTGYTNYERQP